MQVYGSTKRSWRKQSMNSKEKANFIAQCMDDKKALDVEVISLEGKTIIADYFVICSGTSSTHVRGIADEIEFQLSEKEIAYHHEEGYDTAKWILMDYGDVIVHVFYEEDRQYYNLERLWKLC